MTNINTRSTTSTKLPMTIKSNCIRFDSSFNEPLENYEHIIRYVDKILFYRSNFDYFAHMHNHKVQYQYSIILFKNIKILSLPDNYNSEIILSKNTIYLSLGNIYIKPLIFPKKFESLILGFMYNDNLQLTKCTKLLEMGQSYNCYVFTTKNMVSLYIGNKYNCPIVLPKNLIRLIIFIDSRFDLKIILPKKLKIFKPNYKYGISHNLIEYSLKEMLIPCHQFFVFTIIYQMDKLIT